MENQDYTQATEQQAPVEMIEIKFSRKLARPFTTKNGKDMVAISIPNQDQNDKRPWEEFVLRYRWSTVITTAASHSGQRSLKTALPFFRDPQNLKIPMAVGRGRNEPLTTRP